MLILLGSCAWHGIQMGKELIQQGLIQIIGLSSIVNVIRDPWVPKIKGFALTFKWGILIDLDVKVKDFMINGQQLWNLQLLKDKFIEEDVDHIWELLISNFNDNKLLWSLTNSIQFISKFTYKSISNKSMISMSSQFQ